MITSKNNECIKRIASLKEKKGRREQGAYLVEGIKQVREALAGGLPVEQVVLSERYAGDPLPVPPEKQLLVSEVVFAKLSEEASPQGVLAVLRVPACTPRPPKGNSLLLDGIADPGNLGTILRVADWFGVDAVFASRDTVDIFNPKVVQATMGAVFRVRFHYADLPALCRTALSAGGRVYGTFLDGNDIYSSSLATGEDFPVLAVTGNESEGISREVEALCSDLRIPQCGDSYCSHPCRVPPPGAPRLIFRRPPAGPATSRLS